ncbi:MAG: Hsp70 family protein [Thermoguttaceae bacterium]
MRSQSEEPASRFVVGIDLGTTNSAVAYVDTAESPWQVRTFAVPQLVAPGQVEARETLPSCHYEPAPGELAAGALRMPWQKEEPTHVVGLFARDQGALVPGRLIVSAKSWLCHSGVDRTAPLLPWHAAPDVERLSPVDASARLLAHVRQSWDAQHPDAPLAEQDIVLTLPASFDEIARELTVKAAARAGLARVVLIEEPQAAFYAWIYRHADDWDQRVSPGQKILVCDIGGGTSDFTLIRVRRGPSGKVRFHRVAVGEHLILGGDNLDLALAHELERRLAGDGRLQPRQWAILVRKCQRVKELLLGDQAPEQLTVNLAAESSRLIGGGLQIEIPRDEVRRLLLDGFFPRVALDDKPASRRSGFQEFGLPYAPDPAVTRYLAAFLTAHRHVALEEADVREGHDPARPDIVLFNGGLFESSLIRQRLLEVLTSWFRQEDPGWGPIVLENDRLDLAVARGAAYYGMVRRGQGERIAAGLARTYYIGVQSEPPSAVCLVPAGVEPGQDVDLSSRRFDLLVSQPVEFPLFVSSTRLTDKPGELVAIDREQMTPLPPLRTVLRTARKGESGSVSVELHARLTEIGTLDLWCSQIDQRRSWRLVFDVRSATQTDRAAHQSAAEREGFLDEAVWQQCRVLVERTFGPHAQDPPEGLVRRLAEAIGAGRNEWPPSLLRRIWEALLELEPGRRQSPIHEARWLNLLGFALRPGYGLAVDDWRVAETWRRLQGNLVHPAAMCRAEWWILWRRIAGGLAAGQQQALADPLLGAIRGLHHQATTGRGRGGEFSVGSHEAAEVWRLLGSLELLSVATKIELGGILLDLLPRRKMEAARPAMAWALGRIGARQPVYGPLNTVVPAEKATAWLKRFMELDFDDPMAHLAVMLLARRTDDRYRDLPGKQRNEVLAWLARHAAPGHFFQLVEQSGALETQEQDLVFGEALPKGLRIL